MNLTGSNLPKLTRICEAELGFEAHCFSPDHLQNPHRFHYTAPIICSVLHTALGTADSTLNKILYCLWKTHIPAGKRWIIMNFSDKWFKSVLWVPGRGPLPLPGKRCTSWRGVAWSWEVMGPWGISSSPGGDTRKAKEGGYHSETGCHSSLDQLIGGEFVYMVKWMENAITSLWDLWSAPKCQ